jgi:hypothetical protein
VTIRGALFAAPLLLNYIVDVRRPENYGSVLSKDDDTITAWRNVGVVWRRHGILAPIRSADGKRHERSCHKVLADISNHTSILQQKFTALHHLLVVEPDVEVAANAVDVRFGDPSCAGVLGVRMAKGDVDAGKFFVLQNVPDDVR